MPVTIGGSGPITGVTSINTTVSDTELGYLDGVTSALQSQINAKSNDSSQGLYLTTPTSIANSGGTASASGGAVSFSGVTSVSLNGVFSNTYDNYRIVMSVTASTALDLQFRYRASGSDDSGSGNYYNRNGTLGSTYGTSAGSSTFGLIGDLPATQTLLTGDIGGVRTSGFKTSVAWMQNSGGTTSIRILATQNQNSSTFDGITLFPSTGSITGTVRVYGYKN